MTKGMSPLESMVSASGVANIVCLTLSPKGYLRSDITPGLLKTWTFGGKICQPSPPGLKALSVFELVLI